jgi:hypothetical protein
MRYRLPLFDVIASMGFNPRRRVLIWSLALVTTVAAAATVKYVNWRSPHSRPVLVLSAIPEVELAEQWNFDATWATSDLIMGTRWAVPRRNGWLL